MSLAQSLVFNSGVCYFIDGDTTPTPTQINVLQSLSLDFKSTVKKLFGQNKLPIAVGSSQYEVSGKAKFADYQPRQIKDFFGSSMATGQTEIVVNEAHSVPSAASFTVAPINSAGFLKNLGVYYASTGIPLTAVSAAPMVGQYIPATSAAALYTFASADANAGLTINYDWTTTGGETVTISNASAGAANTFETVMGGSWQGNQINFDLYSCVSTSMKVLDSKIGDFSMPEFDFECFCNNANQLGVVSVAQTS
jgi:hypothetical protein